MLGKPVGCGNGLNDTFVSPACACMKEVGIVELIAGDAVEWRTRFTSFVPSSDQRSTLRTKRPYSMSLINVSRLFSIATT